MRTPFVVGYVLIFGISLIAGYWLGQESAPQGIISPNDEISYPLPDSLNSGQINLLMISVTKINEPKPDLQIIWMVAINPDTSIKLIPVYPSFPQDESFDLFVNRAFQLKKEGKQLVLAAEISQLFRERGLKWDGVLILDNRALAYFIDAFGSIKVNGENIDRNQLAAYHFPQFETSQLRVTFNTLLWREICWNILHSPEDIDRLNKDFYKHASLTLSEEISNQEWISLLRNVRIPSCEFPQFFQVVPKEAK